MDGSINDFARNQAVGMACLEYSDKPILMISADNIIVRISHAFCDLIGKTQEEMLGQHLGKFIPDSHSDHPHNEPIDWIAEKYHTDQVPSITRVPFMCPSVKQKVWLNLRVLILKWPGDVRPDFIAFAQVAKDN